MKKFIATILLLIAGLFVADRATGFLYKTIMANANNAIAKKMRTLVYETEADLLLMGTSRCDHHYVPAILKDSLGMSVYNGGFDGSENIYSHYFQLCLVLERYTPKVLVLDVIPNDFLSSKGENNFDALVRFAPYLGINPEADSIFTIGGEYMPYQISHTYRYNYQAISNIGGLFVDTETNRDNGYSPLGEPTIIPQTMPFQDKNFVDRQKLLYLRKFIEKCHEKDIKLILSASPILSELPAGVFTPLEDIAAQYNTPFIDNSAIYLNHPEYFKDVSHLCDKGARQFSQRLGHDLNLLLKDFDNGNKTVGGM